MLTPHYYINKVEAGCDEAGRGCLAGSVYAAAVILPAGYDNPELNDSKQLTVKKRYELRQQIERDAVAWAIGIVTPEEIDKINILKASFLAMHRALDTASIRPSLRRASLPRPIVTTIWMNWMHNIRCTTGNRTRAIPRRSIVRAFATSEYPHFIVNHTIF